MEKAVGYIRVSSPGQAKEGVSLDTQRERIQAWALAAGRDLTIFEDAGLSGSEGDRVKGTESNRPGLTAALAMLESGDALVTYNLSRLGRSSYHLQGLLRVLKGKGVDLVSLTEGIDCTKATGRFTYTIFAGVAELERELIVERITNGIHRKKAAGLVYNGTAPYGKRRRGKYLVDNPFQQRVKQIILRLSKAGKGLSGIARRLNAYGIPASQGGAWHPTTVKRVLTYEG